MIWNSLNEAQTMKTSLLNNKRALLALFATLSCVVSSHALAKKTKAVEFNEIMISSPYKLTQEIIATDILVSKGKELVTFSIDDPVSYTHLTLPTTPYV